MKILKIEMYNLPLYSEPVIIDFYAEQRVNPEKNEMLSNIFDNIYINNVMSIIGINASGKTTTLKAISFVMQMMKNKPINNIDCNYILKDLSYNKEVIIDTYFYDNSIIYKLQTIIGKIFDETEHKDKFIIKTETLWNKKVSSCRSKEKIFLFTDENIIDQRDNTNHFLLEDVSIIVSLNQTNNVNLSSIDSIEWTNFNGLRILGDFPLELVKFLDPSIEYLKCKPMNDSSKIELRLKFVNGEEIFLNSIVELSSYLSSGTIKGINIFIAALITLQKGGYLIIDELENHFNIEIVSTLIKFFTEKKSNRYKATLIFSTHYTELIDDFSRNDSIFICRNMGGIRVEKLNNILKRNDVLKSEWFKSGSLTNTTPSYNRYIEFKRKLIDFVESTQ